MASSGVSCREAGGIVVKSIRMLARVAILCCAAAYGLYMWHATTTDRELANQSLTSQKNGDALQAREKMLQACAKAGIFVDDKSTGVVCEDNMMNGVKVD
jgi:hypothetical protein